MIVIPAIDLMDGQPVRLYQGNYDKKEKVADSCIQTALSFAKAGVKRIHTVDLDGAKAGRRINSEWIADIASSVSVPVETGGGIRSMADIDWYAQHGLAGIILGTAALTDKGLVKEAAAKYPDKIIIGLDCRNGYARGEGWLRSSDVYFTDFAKELYENGIHYLIFTDISKDGTMQGPNLEQLQQLRDAVPDMYITASGGIRNIDDLLKLKAMGIDAAIAGKAVYNGSLDLEDAVRILEDA